MEQYGLDSSGSKNFKISFSSFLNEYKINLKLHFLNSY